ncbi:MAG TPA: hypothetical protein VKB50_02520 [Vicinamibacterales bacterium]|nr:hypothetical protein [Vicinamibacterales bacterium]
MTLSLSRIRAVVIAVLAVSIFGFSWLFRFNDPGGSFAGLTDDHFFYLVRGWQILFGDLPVRDFVDHGAPLFYYVGAAVQTVFGRGTLPELVFCTTVLAIGAAMTFWLATTASGSIAAGLAGVFVHIWLGPRFYNYPKILSYVAAIPLLFWFADQPGRWPRASLAVVTVVAFLFRHDHGAFIAIAMAVLLVTMTGLTWMERLRHAAIYGVLVLVLIAPYLIFIERNGGMLFYFRQASAWAERDRDRAPVVWPGLRDNPDGASDAARSGSLVTRTIAEVRDNRIAFLYYFEIVLPIFALGVVWMSRDGFRPGWPQARAKLTMLAVLTIVLEAGFLRSPLEARLADPSVPLVILMSWLLVVSVKLAVSTASLRPWLAIRPWLARVAVLPMALACILLCVVITSRDFHRRLDKAAMVDRWGKMFEQAGNVAGQLRLDWDLHNWEARPNRPDLITLSLYINTCTAPTDRVLVQSYMPQVLALARRAFAGGHADLRPGFFETEEAQRLTLSRLQRQSVPLILLETDESLRNFRKSFPIIVEYIDREYRLASTHLFDGRFGISLFVRRDRQPESTWAPLDWPCYGSTGTEAHAAHAWERIG